MKPMKFALIGAGNRWTVGYHRWACQNKDKFTLAAVAEPNNERRNFHQKEYGLADSACFTDWKPMLEYLKGHEVDGVIICTSDHDHYEPALACLKQGYHLLLEKPMAPTPRECAEIVKLANEKNRIVMVAHVLRYTPFFTKIRHLLQDGAIGTVQSIQHTENVGYFHMANSFVRGNWRKQSESNPIIVAKSCHDMDILLYILGGGVKASRVAGFGNLNHFKKENAPKGAPSRCSSECPVYDTCPYSIKTYLSTGGFSSSVKGSSQVPLEELLKTSPYGRCVYHCDNDVCDTMSTIIEYNNGVNAVFSLSAFTDQINRTINVMGSHGQLRGDMEKDEIIVAAFGAGEGPYRNGCTTTYYPSKEMPAPDYGYSGHGGGDARFLEDFIMSLRGEGETLTRAEESLESHLIAFALEESRIGHKMIDMKEYVSRIM